MTGTDITEADAVRAAALLRRIANDMGGRWMWELGDVADLLEPGAHGAPSTPFETVRGRVAAYYTGPARNTERVSDGGEDVELPSMPSPP